MVQPKGQLYVQDLIGLFQPSIRPDNLRPLALLLELLTVIPEEFSTLILSSQKRSQVMGSLMIFMNYLRPFLMMNLTLKFWTNLRFKGRPTKYIDYLYVKLVVSPFLKTTGDVDK